MPLVRLKSLVKQLRSAKPASMAASVTFLWCRIISMQALLSKFERGERTPPTETLMILADFYNVSIDYILCRTENPDVNR